LIFLIFWALARGFPVHSVERFTGFQVILLVFFTILFFTVAMKEALRLAGMGRYQAVNL